MLRLLSLLVVLLLAGCAPKEPPPPPAPVKSELELKREKFFGAAAAQDATIDWRSSGLGVKMLAPGEGVSPTASDKVRVHYTGTVADGTVFDDTRAKNKPAQFALSQLLRGMTEGIGYLKPGGRAVLYIPPSLGYGSMRAGSIPPVSGLTFDVELLEVLPRE
ncbi:MAG: FKBP-type peptidyl-prolyl cis-trans isomerase FklB [Verrucomicrobiota bacterium]|nr:FKBP-type peptidyl-prolyl cis-trans isomerase FklB [Verrucomicrobiota bacterium]